MGKKYADSKPLFTDSVKPTVAVTRARFIADTGEQITVRGTRARGVSNDDFTATDIAAGAVLGIVCLGIADLEVDGPVTKGAKLTSSAAGKGSVAAAGETVNAIALEASDADGDHVQAFVIQSDRPVASAANADTSGATLGNLEIEVNELKAVLRAHGLLTP